MNPYSIPGWGPKACSSPSCQPQVHWCHVALRDWRTWSNQSASSAATGPGEGGVRVCAPRVPGTSPVLALQGPHPRKPPQFWEDEDGWCPQSAQEDRGSENSPTSGRDICLSQTVPSPHPRSIQGPAPPLHTWGQEKTIHPNSVTRAWAWAPNLPVESFWAQRRNLVPVPGVKILQNVPCLPPATDPIPSVIPLAPTPREI